MGNDRLTAATRAAASGCIEDMQLCIEFKCDLNKRDGNGDTPLMIACKERERDMVSMLVRQPGVDVNLSDGSGRNVVILCSQFGYADNLEILLTVPNIDVVHRDEEGMTAFDHAVSCNQKQCAKQLHQFKNMQGIVDEPKTVEMTDARSDENQNEDEQIVVVIRSPSSESKVVLHGSDSVDRQIYGD